MDHIEQIMNKTSRGTGGGSERPDTGMFQARFGRLVWLGGDSRLAREPNVDGALGSRSKSHAGTGAVPYTR